MKQTINNLIEAMGMMSENMQRQALGQSMAYTEIDFVNLIKEKQSQDVKLPGEDEVLEYLNDIKI